MAQHSAASGAVVDGGADLYPLEPPWCVGASAGVGAATRRHQAGHGVPRRHHDSGPPESGWCGKKGGSSAQRDKREALGRSRGGFSTKACVLADGSGRAVGFALAPGQADELPMAPVLLTFLTALALWIVADRGYSSHALRMLIWSLGSRPAIPAKRNEASVACPSWIYNNRNLVEGTVASLGGSGGNRRLRLRIVGWVEFLSVARTKRTIVDGAANLEEEIGPSPRPAHVLRFVHPPIDQEIGRPLRDRGTNPQAGTVPLGVIDHPVALAGEIAIQRVQGGP